VRYAGWANSASLDAISLRSLDAIIYLPSITLIAGWSRADVQNRSIDMTAVKTSGGQ
jgi:hypothetical protein